jgi:hypothetical protein
MAEADGFRTTLTLPATLVDEIDDLLHQGKKSGQLPRNLNRNPFIVQLLSERVAQLSGDKAASARPKKRPGE